MPIPASSSHTLCGILPSTYTESPWQSMRGADTASWAVIPKSTTFRIVCNTAPMMKVPPGAPRTMKGSPSLYSRHGDDPVIRIFPGAMELGPPGIGSKAIM